ncbi:NADH-cytochrome b5 reductase [Claviceps citrina]|nr:NADH-cytochrome b5 reductase [Claviceps citrina]
MFARCVFRAAQPLRTQARRYATEPGAKSGSGSSTTAALFAAGAAGLGGGAGYYFYYGGGSGVGSATQAAKPAPAEAAEPAKPAFVGGDQGFVSLRLADVEQVNHNTKRLRFELPEADQVSGLAVASAVLTKYKGPGDEKATVRPYTPISDEDEKGFLDLLVKKYPNGPMSTHMHDMVPGQRLDFKGPLPKYEWAENKHEHVALIAGGTGITPMYQLCRAIFNNANDRTKVTLVFGNVSERDILLRRELAHLENTFPQRFRAFYVLDKAPEGWPAGASGFISRDLLKTVLPEPREGDKVKVFVCGPPGLMKAISGPKVSPRDQGELSGVLKDLGYSKEQVYKF